VIPPASLLHLQKAAVSSLVLHSMRLGRPESESGAVAVGERSTRVLR
jgi:hypothetical protein